MTNTEEKAIIGNRRRQELTTRTKDRIYYWSTVVPLVSMLLYLHSEYKDQLANNDRLIDVSNRQVEAKAASYTNFLTEQSIRQMNEIVKLEEHHKQEIGECVEFYSQVIEEIKNQ